MIKNVMFEKPGNAAPPETEGFGSRQSQVVGEGDRTSPVHNLLRAEEAFNEREREQLLENSCQY